MGIGRNRRAGFRVDGDTMSPTEQPPIIVEQGPEWLVDLYFSPPAWLNPMLKLLALATLLIVAYRIAQNEWTVKLETQTEMQIIAGYIVAITTCTLAMVNLFHLPYLVDVLIGTVTGSIAVYLPQTDYINTDIDSLKTEEDRVNARWFLLAVIAVAGPVTVAVRDTGIIPFGTRWFIVGLAGVAIVYNVGTDREPSVADT